MYEAGTGRYKHILCRCDPCKGCGNSKKSKKILVAKKTARFYDEQLREEIDKDREEHGRKPLKDKDDNDNNGGNTPTGGGEQKEKKVSTTDPESGWFHKGEHKEVFAYSVEAASDKHGWIMGYTIHPGNEHNSQTFPAIYEKLKGYDPKKIVIDAGYKTPAIAKMLIDDGITPIMPYKRPMTKKGFFKQSEYVYDELYDCYIGPNDQILSYRTTNRDGYREYKSDPIICGSCPYLSQCTKSKLHQKTVVRHVWEDYLEQCEDIRQTIGMKDIYDKRKQTIERIFGTAKEHHGMRYTQMLGKAKMSMKVGLTFACMNMKKLVKIMDKRFRDDPDNSRFFMISRKMPAYI